MTTAITKFQLGTAALAMGAAATLIPVVAQADMAPLAPSLTSFAQALGGGAGEPLVCDPATSDCSTAAVVAGKSASATGSLLQNNFIWTSLPNGEKINAVYWNDPGTKTIMTVDLFNVFPFQLLPGILATQVSQTCVGGLSSTIGGAYAGPGQYVSQYNPKGCNAGQ